MSIFGLPNNNNTMDDITFEAKTIDALAESYFYDEFSRLPDDQREKFVNSEAATLLVENNLVARNTMIRLSKNDDLSRRIQMASLQLASDANDAVFKKLAALRIKEKQYLEQISKKFGSKATKIAKVAQKEFLKKAPIGYIRK